MKADRFKTQKKVFFTVLWVFLFLSCFLAETGWSETYQLVTYWGGFGRTEGRFYEGGPNGVAVDPAGDVYVVDSGNNRIQKFASDGTYITQWGSGGSEEGQFAYPEGIAVDTSGNIYVADAYNHRIQKFDANGVFITKWGSNGTGNGQFNYPNYLAVAASGNVYVADTGNSRIQKFASDGTFLTQWGSDGSGEGQFSYPEGIAVDTSGNIYVADAGNSRIQKFDANGVFITKWYPSINIYAFFLSGVAADRLGNVFVTVYDDSLSSLYQKFVQKFSLFPPSPSKPAVITYPATATNNGAKLKGKINPKGSATSYYFQWGPDTSYGNTTPTQTIGSGMTDMSVSDDLNGLNPGFTYHCRLWPPMVWGLPLGRIGPLPQNPINL